MPDPLMSWLMLPDVPDWDDVLAELIRRPAWQLDAACRGSGVEKFVIERGVSPGPARQLCSGCSVRAECLAYAVADPELQGIWGGTSARERRQIRRGRAA